MIPDLTKGMRRYNNGPPPERDYNDVLFLFILVPILLVVFCG